MPLRFMLVTSLAIALTACSCASDTGTNPNLAPPPGGGSDGGGVPAGAKGTVLTDSFPSAALGITKRYVVYLPPTYATQPSKRYPVVYLLHGNPGTEHDWADLLNVNQVLDSLAHAGAPEVIAVMPDGDSWFWHDWVSVPPACSGQPWTGEKPSEPCVPGLKYNYGTYMYRDVVNHIDATYRTKADMAHRAIMGVSVGGYGSAYQALAHPDVYGAAGVMGGARLNGLTIRELGRKATSLAEIQAYSTPNNFTHFVAEYGTNFSNAVANEPVSMVGLSKQAGRRIPPMWIIVGQSDGLHPGSEELDAALTKAGVEHVFSEPPGDHSGPFWRAHEGDALAWLLQHIGS